MAWSLAWRWDTGRHLQQQHGHSSSGRWAQLGRCLLASRARRCGLTFTSSRHGSPQRLHRAASRRELPLWSLGQAAGWQLVGSRQLRRWAQRQWRGGGAAAARWTLRSPRSSWGCRPGPLSCRRQQRSKTAPPLRLPQPMQPCHRWLPRPRRVQQRVLRRRRPQRSSSLPQQPTGTSGRAVRSSWSRRLWQQTLRIPATLLAH